MVSYLEFITGLSAACRGSRDQKMRLLFELYDVNGDGCVSKEELTTLLNQVPYEVLHPEEQNATASPPNVPYVTEGSSCGEDGLVCEDGEEEKAEPALEVTVDPDLGLELGLGLSLEASEPFVDPQPVTLPLPSGSGQQQQGGEGGEGEQQARAPVRSSPSSSQGIRRSFSLNPSSDREGTFHTLVSSDKESNHSIDPETRPPVLDMSTIQQQQQEHQEQEYGDDASQLPLPSPMSTPGTRSYAYEDYDHATGHQRPPPSSASSAIRKQFTHPPVHPHHHKPTLRHSSSMDSIHSQMSVQSHISSSSSSPGHHNHHLNFQHMPSPTYHVPGVP